MEKWMTKNEAIICLEAWRIHYIPDSYWIYDSSSKARKHITGAVKYAYLESLINELEDRIRTSEEDPITEVAMYMTEMEYMVENCDPSHELTIRFAGFMADAANELLWYLRKQERKIVR